MLQMRLSQREYIKEPVMRFVWDEKGVEKRMLSTVLRVHNLNHNSEILSKHNKVQHGKGMASIKHT